jgi:ribosomal protein S11
MPLFDDTAIQPTSLNRAEIGYNTYFGGRAVHFDFNSHYSAQNMAEVLANTIHDMPHQLSLVVLLQRV